LLATPHRPRPITSPASARSATLPLPGPALRSHTRSRSIMGAPIACAPPATPQGRRLTRAPSATTRPRWIPSMPKLRVTILVPVPPAIKMVVVDNRLTTRKWPWILA
jgi:hypothetical protein